MRVECVLVPPDFDGLLGGWAKSVRRAQDAERRADMNGRLALVFFGLFATSWHAALLWFLPK